MKIVSLEAQNVMVLEAFQVSTNGASVVKVTGKNGAGKSTALNCISMAMEGTKKIPSEPITKGKDKGHIILDLGELVVKRTFTKKGGSLIVKAKDGSKVATPQAILDQLTGKLAFDPLSFASMSPKEQFKTLCELTDLNFDGLESDRADSYRERTEVNRLVKMLKNQLEEYDIVPDDTPDQELDVAELSRELDRAQIQNLDSVKLQRAIENQQEIIEDTTKDINFLKARLEEEKKQLADLEEEQKDLPEEIDLEPIRQKISSANEVNHFVRAKKKKVGLQLQLEAHQDRVCELEEDIEKHDKDKATMLGMASYPVEGLGLDPDTEQVTFNELPFDQASSAEQLRVSVAMGLELNPELKVLLIRDGSLLDDDNLSMIAKMADKAGAQVWIERVGDSKEVQVVIEEGDGS